MAERILKDGHSVTGFYRPSSSDNLWRLRELGVIDRIDLAAIDVNSYNSVQSYLKRVKFDAIFHFAGSSFTAEDFEQSLQTFTINTNAVINLLEGVRLSSPESLVYIASSSEIFGSSGLKDEKQAKSSKSNHFPVNSYAVSHVANFHSVAMYQKVYGLRIALPIMFNHESEMRSPQFLTQKLCAAAVRMLNNSKIVLELGNLNAQKDWGSAREFVEILYSAAQKNIEGAFVLGTGNATSVRDIISRVFSCLDLEIKFVGVGIEESVIEAKSGRVLVTVNPRYMRRIEMSPYVADRIEMSQVLERLPIKTVSDVIPMMIKAEQKRMRAQC